MVERTGGWGNSGGGGNGGDKRGFFGGNNWSMKAILDTNDISEKTQLHL
jgi:hypothetical protein